MELICRKCNTIILTQNINISTDLAKCDNCNSVYRASSLVDSFSIKVVSKPPRDTKMIFKAFNEDQIEILYPKKGFTLSIIPSLLFCVIWLSFISSITFMFPSKNVMFLLFSIPFWLIGLGMLKSLVNSIFETQIIRFSNNTLELIKNKPIGSKTIKIKTSDIQTIRMKLWKTSAYSLISQFNLLLKMQKSMEIGGFEVPAIIYNSKVEYFFEDVNDVDQEWITHLFYNLITYK